MKKYNEVRLGINPLNGYLKWFILFVLAIFSCNSGEKVVFERFVVWDAGENDFEGYRIPGIVVANDGSILAFTEERPDFGDEAPKSIVLKRSEDGGRNWSDNIYIEKSDGSFWADNSYAVDPDDIMKKKEVWTNIAPIVDKITGRVYFFYALSEGSVAGQNLQRYTRVFHRYSDDAGKTWSMRKEVTDVLKSKADGFPNKDEKGQWILDENGHPCDYLGRAFHMPGPGHGIQLADGRLLLQLWNRTALGVLHKGQIPVKERKYGISTLYSDDHGNTWQYGSAFGHELNMNESRIAELKNGEIYLNARYTSESPEERNNHRATALSKDGGITWENIRIDENFPASNQCDAGLITTDKTFEGRQILLYSKNESTEGRKNLNIRLSYDGGKTWPLSKVVDDGPAWYSDLAILDNNTVLILYETGKNSPVYCVKFGLEWLTN
jgi:sialidase-1